jgi:hypothetical protein
MKETIYVRALANGYERKFLLPMNGYEILTELREMGEECIVIDSEGVYPIESEFEHIPSLNESIQKISDIQEENGYTDEEIRAIFEASDESREETTQRILSGSFQITNLTEETSTWASGIRDEVKAAGSGR